VASRRPALGLASALGPACPALPSCSLCPDPCMIADSLMQEAIGEALILPRLSWHGGIPRLSRPLSRSIQPHCCTDCRMKSRKKIPLRFPLPYTLRNLRPRPYSLAPFPAWIIPRGEIIGQRINASLYLDMSPSRTEAISRSRFLFVIVTNKGY
jgi:hypothetical protein